MTQTVTDIRFRLVDEWCRREASDPPDMIELLGTSFLADEDTILPNRPRNDAYIERELEWYLSQSRRVEDMPGEVPEIWHKVASRLGEVNSNYGYLVFNHGNGDQYGHVRDELRRNRDSRRGTMVYTRPSIQWEYMTGGMSDFICTNAVNYFIRDDRLHAVVQMRSNDAVFGYPNDLAWQRYVLERLAGDVDAEVGPITWQAASLHVYPRHFYLLEELCG